MQILDGLHIFFIHTLQFTTNNTKAITTYIINVAGG